MVVVRFVRKGKPARFSDAEIQALAKEAKGEVPVYQPDWKSEVVQLCWYVATLAFIAWCLA